MPLPISIQSVRDELSGSGMDRYLSRLGDEAAQDAVITRAIKEAKSEIEIDCNTRFFVTIFKSAPVDDGLVRGEDYNEVESPYDYYSFILENSPGVFRTRVRPIATVERITLRYGGVSNPVRQFSYPSQWIIENARMGQINIVPLIGLSAGQTGASYMLPIIGMVGSSVIPSILGLDYSAGFLRSDFDPDFEYDPETDDEDLSDPRAMSPDHDVVALLAALRYITAAKMLQKLNRALGAGGGSISLDGLSQSYQPARFMQEIQGYQQQAQEIKSLYKSQYAPPRSFVM